MSGFDHPLSPLRALDAELLAERRAWFTLNPERRRATSVTEQATAALARAQLGVESHPALSHALAVELRGLIGAVREHFPDNQYWDYDALVARLVVEADGSVERLSAGFRETVELHALFGCHTAIRFRYVHDFLYAFDWARWVMRDPSTRQATHPYEAAFRAHMLSRGRALLEQIAHNDRKYPPLEGAGHRNPFGFSREPAAERALHEALARRGELPLRPWRIDAEPCADRDYGAARDRCAAELGILTDG